MKKLLILIPILFILNHAFGQTKEASQKTEVMTLGVFHFAYPNLDVAITKDKDKISVLEEPYQSEIIAISKAISEYRPTIIAVEIDPEQQNTIDSLYKLYQLNQFDLKKGEEYQLGFRIGKNLNIPTIYCVNDWGKHYESTHNLFKDSAQMAEFEEYYYANLTDKKESEKVVSIVDELYKLNDPEMLKKRLSVYLQNPFKYEIEEGDFTGVDFETGRWFNRNLRILRNIQRIPADSENRILLIIGKDHLNLLNWFIDVSEEFELVSPMPYLENAKHL
ncbi:MAG: DUF5694 domain-containing protein [Bacteroidales bacterium]